MPAASMRGGRIFTRARWGKSDPASAERRRCRPLSIGSAAGVALMGQARGVYTFFAHLKWTWAIALGYAASIWVHLLINRHLF